MSTDSSANPNGDDSDADSEDADLDPDTEVEMSVPDAVKETRWWPPPPADHLSVTIQHEFRGDGGRWLVATEGAEDVDAETELDFGMGLTRPPGVEPTGAWIISDRWLPLHDWE